MQFFTKSKVLLLSLWGYEKIRFLIIGGFNTLLSFSSFTALYYWLCPPWHYLSVLTLSFVFSVSVAFLLMKSLVFRSQGDARKEYLRCLLTYGVNFLVNVFLLHLFVATWGTNVVLAQFLVTIWMVFQSYYTHKYISFNPQPLIKKEVF